MKNSPPDWSRRQFIRSVSGAGAGVMLFPALSWTVDVDPRITKIVAQTIGIDSHNHIDVPLEKAELPGPKLDLADDLKKSGLSALVMTFATDYKRNIQPGEAYERYLSGLTALDNVLAANDMTRALTLTDIKAAHKKKQGTVIQSVEGCHFLEGKAARVEEAYKRGLRHLGLLHDSDAAVPLGDVYTNPAQFGGLTMFGADVIKECNRLGILIDLTHASNDTINAALTLATKPVIISHTALDTQLGSNERMARVVRPRLISKEQAKIVADAGGLIGVWTHLSDTPLDYARNIRALVDVIGVDHVCLGTDTKLTPPYRSPASAGGPPPGSAPDNKPAPTKRIGEQTNDAWAEQKVGFYYAVVDALLKTSFNESEIAKLGGGNYCRIFEKATTVH